MIWLACFCVALGFMVTLEEEDQKFFLKKIFILPKEITIIKRDGPPTVVGKVQRRISYLLLHNKLVQTSEA